MAKTQYVIRCIDNTTDEKNHFFSHTTNAKKRIERIKQILAQETVPFEHMKAFKGQQDKLTYETYKLVKVLKWDDIKV